MWPQNLSRGPFGHYGVYLDTAVPFRTHRFGGFDGMNSLEDGNEEDYLSLPKTGIVTPFLFVGPFGHDRVYSDRGVSSNPRKQERDTLREGLTLARQSPTFATASTPTSIYSGPNNKSIKKPESES